MGASGHDFKQISQMNPCTGCPAPCCRVQVVPYRIPATYTEIDFIYYMLQFPRTEMVVTLTGDTVGWSIVKWEDCGAFEASTFTCKLHHMPEKPRMCRAYDAYNCWYKRCFVVERSPEVNRLDMARFKAWVNEIQFADDGKIISAPDFERSVEILNDMPIEPHFQMLTSEALASDPRTTDASQYSKNENRNRR